MYFQDKIRCVSADIQILCAPVFAHLQSIKEGLSKGGCSLGSLKGRNWSTLRIWMDGWNHIADVHYSLWISCLILGVTLESNLDILPTSNALSNVNLIYILVCRVVWYYLSQNIIDLNNIWHVLSYYISDFIWNKIFLILSSNFLSDNLLFENKPRTTFFSGYDSHYSRHVLNNWKHLHNKCFNTIQRHTLHRVPNWICSKQHGIEFRGK